MAVQTHVKRTGIIDYTCLVLWTFWIKCFFYKLLRFSYSIYNANTDQLLTNEAIHLHDSVCSHYNSFCLGNFLR